MAEKFVVVRWPKITIAETTHAVVMSLEISNATAARATAHQLARDNPGEHFTIIQIIGHAVADLVRDVEP